MKRLPVLIAVALSVPSQLLAQDPTPFKLGTFEDGAERYLGLVLDDVLVVNIAQANSAPGMVMMLLQPD